MKLQTRFLLVPMAAAILMLALGAASTMALRDDEKAMVALHTQGDVAGSFQRVRALAAEASSLTYRLIAIVGSADETRINAERARLVRPPIAPPLVRVFELAACAV